MVLRFLTSGLFRMPPMVAQADNVPLMGAQADGVRKVSQWDYHSPATWTGTDWLLAGAFLLAIVMIVVLYRRDARGIDSRWRPWWTGWLSALRIGVVLALLVIFLNPHERTETQAFRPSRVVLLVDTSASMEQPEVDPRKSEQAKPPSRSAALKALLAESPLIEELRKLHDVDLYAFDSDLSDTRFRLPTRHPLAAGSRSSAASNAATTTASEDAAFPLPDWETLLQPSGQSTRLGDSLDKLLADVSRKSLSGVVVFTDGANNAGRDWQAANQRAKDNGVRLLTVGLGSTDPPVNLEIVRIIAPSDVQLGDPFEITGLVQSSGLASPSAAADNGSDRGNNLPRESHVVTVELLEKSAANAEPNVVDQADVTLTEDGVPVSVVFERRPEQAAEIEYGLRVRGRDITESRDDDNERFRTVNIFDRPLRVLAIAGGPMRDYLLARNALYRHKSMEIDVWLQSGEPGIGQDADNVLFDFPSGREELFRYDVVMAFDPDWERIPEESRKLLEEWVTEFGGGIILVAGDVYTPQLAQVNPERNPAYKPILNLYPVVLEEVGLRLGSRNESTKAYQVGLTQAGAAASFLQLTDDPATSHDVWEEFPGVFRCYPTRGRKGGATVYAEFTDPLARGRDGQPVLLAGQRYGLGSGLYLGSPELWRIRSLDEQYYDRFWTKLVRKAAEGRLKRGLERTLLLLEGRDYEIGQSVPVRARVVDVDFQPLDVTTLDVNVTDPTGRPLIPPLTLQQDRNRPEEYFGTFRVSVPGRYSLQLASPRGNETATSELAVVMPQLEASNPLQNVSLLKNLAEGTGGRYLPLPEAVASLPALLPDMGHEILLDQRVRERWDRQWVMILIGTLLALEWLTRKMLRLA